jgi:hypothetical protein
MGLSDDDAAGVEGEGDEAGGIIPDLSVILVSPLCRGIGNRQGVPAVSFHLAWSAHKPHRRPRPEFPGLLPSYWARPPGG